MNPVFLNLVKDLLAGGEASPHQAALNQATKTPATFQSDGSVAMLDTPDITKSTPIGNPETGGGGLMDFLGKAQGPLSMIGQGAGVANMIMPKPPPAAAPRRSGIKNVEASSTMQGGSAQRMDPVLERILAKMGRR
jgi:hypothetical protein